MNTALVVACISGVVALASAGLSAWTQQQVMKQAKQGRAEDRRSDAKVVLDRYRGPLLDAAWQLGDRLDSIRHRGFLAYLSEGSGRERDAKLTALFRFAHYFGWRELVRTEVQLLRFENEQDTRSAAGFLTDVAEVLASDLLAGKRAMLWNDEQRGIGELMTERPSRTAPIVRGHAAFTVIMTNLRALDGALRRRPALACRSQQRPPAAPAVGVARAGAATGRGGHLWRRLDRPERVGDPPAGTARKFHPARGTTQKASRCDRTIDLLFTMGFRSASWPGISVKGQIRGSASAQL